MIVIVNYGCGNLGSIQNMLKKIGRQAIVSSSVSDIDAAEKLILPGIGSFDTGMSNLKEKGFIEILHKKALQEKIPVLGICLGMQLMTSRSDEGKLSGLGWIDAETVRFNIASGDKLKVPHMGWNYVNIPKHSRLFTSMYEHPKFYFVHSFHVKCNDRNDELCFTNYSYPFVSAFERGNIMGVQYHPEKSHKYGMMLLKNFSEL